MIRTNEDFPISPLWKFKTEIQRSQTIALKILWIKDKLRAEAMLRIYW